MASTYELRLDYTDGTFAVRSVKAASITEAVASVKGADVEHTTLLCIVDNEPQVFLAW